MRNILRIVSCFLVLSSCYLISCNSDSEPVATIASIDPAQGDYNSTVTINGANFSPSLDGNEVFFGTVAAEVISATATQLQVTVPPGAASGKIRIKSNGKETSSTTEYKVTSGTWATNGVMQSFVAAATSTSSFVINGKLYIHQAKATSNGTPVPGAFWAYDPSAKTLVSRKVLSTDFNAAQVVEWSSATKGYTFNGLDLYEYDPAADAWTKKASPNFSFAPVAAMYFEETKLAYLFGGDKTIWIYSATNNTWAKSLSAIPTAFSYAEVYSTVVGNQAYLTGAVNTTTAFWKFDPTSAALTQLKNYPGNTPNFIFTLNGEVYVGGTLYEPTPKQGQWKYDAAKNDWIQKAGPGVQRNSPLYFTIGNAGYIACGSINQTSAYVYDVFVYVP